MRTLLIVLVVLALATGGFLLGRSPLADSFFRSVPSTDGVVQRVQSLSRLETTRYTIETVVTADEKGFIETPLGRFQIGSDRVLLIVYGRVVAGIDLDKLRPDAIDTSADGQTVTVHLPPVEVFSVDLDNNKTTVYSRETWLKRPNPNLESEARRGGVAKILAAACEDGIMQRATEDAQRAVERFLQALHLDYESIRVLPAPTPTCPAVAP